MSRHGRLRENKRCENCGHFVEKRFCPECGQENVVTRQRFYYLFTHFVEDFVHYDSRFWKTILYLLFRPAKLTREYLAGKRKLYVPPVTLYIFICFITFTIPVILPDSGQKKNEKKHQSRQTETLSDTVPNTAPEAQPDNKKYNVVFHKQDYSSKFEELIKDFDKEKWIERIKHDFQKAIFFYMPVFAFWLWLFHSKKKWYYFDHGIYTLHYFSFILLSTFLYILINWNLSFFQIKTGFFYSVITPVMLGYFIYYFFHSHRLVYGENKTISRLKCTLLFFINSFCMFLFLIIYVVIEAIITSDGSLLAFFVKKN